MKKTFYEILWDLCEDRGLIDEWKLSGLLLHNDSRYAWHPDVAEVLNQDIEVIGSIGEDKKEITPTLKKTKEDDSLLDWIDDFRNKFSKKNLGVLGKTTDLKTVNKKLKKFLKEYDYTKDEILGATDLYVNTMKSKGSINYIRDCGYFIYKRIDGIDQSDLANFCEEYRQNGSSGGYNSRTIL